VEQLLNETFWGNTVKEYLIAAALFIGGVIIVWVFKKIILARLKKWAKKTKTTIDDFIIIGIRKSIVPILYYGAFYLAIGTLSLSTIVDTIVNVLSIFVIVFFAIRLITSTLDYAISSYASRQEGEDQKAKQLKSISALARFVIWGIGLVFLLDNLGFDITAVVAGLGIGGIAVAIAAQAILGDLFSYFVIFFDRPFEIGDFVNVDDKTGNIEHIGIKSTRIRALSGEQLVLSNTDLTSSRIHNYKKLQRRRVVFQLGVIYQTTADKLKIIPELVKQIIVDHPDAEFDRAHFKSFGDFSLNFEFVYYVLSSEYRIYMDIQQAINLKIYEKFEKEGIEFAYPTQTLFLTKDENGLEEKRTAA
jgi:small-conductance mechanosensitive channel